jgi:hypothetical protein
MKGIPNSSKTVKIEITEIFVIRFHKINRNKIKRELHCKKRMPQFGAKSSI